MATATKNTSELSILDALTRYLEGQVEIAQNEGRSFIDISTSEVQTRIASRCREMFGITALPSTWARKFRILRNERSVWSPSGSRPSRNPRTAETLPLSPFDSTSMADFSSRHYRMVKHFADSLASLGAKLYKKLRETSLPSGREALERINFTIIAWAPAEDGTLHYSLRSSVDSDRDREEMLTVLDWVQSGLESKTKDRQKGPLGLPIHDQ